MYRTLFILFIILDTFPRSSSSSTPLLGLGSVVPLDVAIEVFGEVGEVVVG